MSLFHLCLRTPPPDVPAESVYQEQRAYGPGQGRFASAWTVSVAPRWPACREVLALTDGLITVGAGPGGTVALRLQPLPQATLALAQALGGTAEAPAAFRYGNLDAVSLPAYFARRIGAAPNPDRLTPRQRLERFLAGHDAVAVRAGEAIGLAGRRPGQPTPVVSLAVELPHGRRLDPVALLHRLPLSHAERATLSFATRRLLLEVRTDQNRPYLGEVRIGDGGRQSLSLRLSRADRGHVVLPSGWSRYRIKASGARLTELPGGARALPEVERTLAAPAHLTLQAMWPEDWFAEATPPRPSEFALPRYTEGNRVTALVDGIEAFRAMWQEYRRVCAPGHFIYLAAWWMQDSFPLVPGDPQSTFAALTCRANRLGAAVRALIWAPAEIPSFLRGHPLWQWLWPNPDVVRRINRLAHGKAILDSRTVRRAVPAQSRGPLYRLAAQLAELVGRVVHIGSHHQKFTVINNADGLVAFCGGMDLERTRLQRPGHLFPPRHFDPCCEAPGYHDVHCKVEGPAALDLLRTFRDRWQDHPDRPDGDTLAGSPPLRTPAASHFVQVARTYPAGVGYAFAPTGDRTLLATVERAIRRARRFIYIEDQYLVYPGVRDALLSVIDRLQHLTFVIPLYSDLPQDHYRRRQFIAPLRERGGDRVRVFWLRNRHGLPVYVHSKLILVDDVFVMLGSANMTRRGYTHDSELMLAVLDGAVEGAARKFARDLRMRLWAEHLGFYHPLANRYLHLPLLADPDAAAALWRRPAPLSLAVPYDETQAADVLSEEFAEGLWELLWDPDGSQAP